MKKIYYTIGLEAGRSGQKWTATALTDRAKERTPESATFVGRPEALKFLKDSQSEGYRFSGAELVDQEQRLVKNRYFIIGSDGELTLSGEGNGPRDTVWELGDMMPGCDRSTGTEAIVENILQGVGVRERFGCDLAFVLRLHRVSRGILAMPSIPPFDPDKPCPCGLHGKSYGDCCKEKSIRALGNEMLRGTVLRMVPGALSQIQSSMVKDDTRFRFVWNELWQSPQDQTFHQFLDDLVLKTLTREWFEQQKTLVKNQNAIASWREAMLKLLLRPGEANDNISTGHTLTGPTKAYLCLGYDLYWLQLVHRLPEALINKFKQFDKFQGARYEILVAAVFTRAGFEIEWIDDTKASGKHPEFIATHKRTGEKVGVEAKSRRRSGGINFPGPVTPETHLKGDVLHLYDQAIKKPPAGEIPFLIFIDPNWPDSPPPSYSDIPIDNIPWMKEIRDHLLEKWNAATEPTPESAVLITNFAFYYGDNDGPSPTGMAAFFPSPDPRVPIFGDPMIDDLRYCLQTYGTVPRQI